jgi:anti-anti-sigma factor
MPVDPFHAAVVHLDGSAEIIVRGAVDLTASDTLTDVLRRGYAHSPRVVVDASAITFIDAAGIGGFIRATQEAGADATLVFRSPSPPVVRILDLTGLDAMVSIVDEGDAPSAGSAHPLDGRRQAHDPH